MRRSERRTLTLDRELLLECMAFGLCVCRTYLSPEALGGWTPLLLDDES